jgi:hypothetical protein
MNFHSFCAFIYYCIITIIYKFITKEIYLLKDSVATQHGCFSVPATKRRFKTPLRICNIFYCMLTSMRGNYTLFFFFFFSKRVCQKLQAGGIETGLFFPRKDLLTVEPKTHLDRMQRFKYINSYLHIRPDLLQPLKKNPNVALFSDSPSNLNPSDFSHYRSVLRIPYVKLNLLTSII